MSKDWEDIDLEELTPLDEKSSLLVKIPKEEEEEVIEFESIDGDLFELILE
jgi:hypothetical protein